MVPLSRAEASVAVQDSAWRYLLGALAVSVHVSSLTEGAEAAAAAAKLCGDHADGHLLIDVRADRVLLTLRTVEDGGVTERDVELSRALSAEFGRRGLGMGGATSQPHGRSVQGVEVAIDALDIPRVRPFWKAVLAYEDEPDDDESTAALLDPARQGPAVWFQQMDAPRSQRNRIHLDLTVPHDEAEGRIAGALAAGGTLVSDAHARAFWVLADAEGNEVCVCTWQDRD